MYGLSVYVLLIYSIRLGDANFFYANKNVNDIILFLF